MSEVNFDGLVGPTHNYAGLSYGNVASIKNAQAVSNPRLAAKQGLEKMRILMDLGLKQGILPPQQRPNLRLLRTLGFVGTPLDMLQQAYYANPQLVVAVYSASSMWAANAATISASCNTEDGLLHITPANLAYNLHRSQESTFNYKLFSHIFDNKKYFRVHPPLPSNRDICDEGDANHSIICREYNTKGLELFVYGRSGLKDTDIDNNKYIARQTQLASMALTLNHRLYADNTILLQQSPLAIDAGVFHNDVIFVANKNVLFYHTDAFVEWEQAYEQINNFFAGDCYFIAIKPNELSLNEAVNTYLFNSQLISIDNKMILLAPSECKESKQAQEILEKILAADNPINEVKYIECRESMRNGGGPACLRLRMQLTELEQAKCQQNLFLTPELYSKLNSWVDKHYRDRLTSDDLLDPQLLDEVQFALDELTKILNIGNLYDFQQI